MIDTPELLLWGAPELRAGGVVVFAPERRFQLLALPALKSGEWGVGFARPDRGAAVARPRQREGAAQPAYVVFKAHAVPGGPAVQANDRALRWDVATDNLALAGNARPAFANPGQKASNYAIGGARAVLYDCRFNLPQQIDAYLADLPQASVDSWMAMEIGGNHVRDALVAAFMNQDPFPRLEQALVRFKRRNCLAWA